MLKANAATRTGRDHATRSSGGAIDKFLVIPLLAMAFALIAQPIILSSCAPTDSVCLLASRPENKVFWPALAAIAIALIAWRGRPVVLPTHIKLLFAYLAFAGLSVLWALKSDVSLIRYLQQVMIITAVVLPTLVANDRADAVRGLFYCFALASTLNALFVVFGPPPLLSKYATFGYVGYFSGKNYLGECAAITILLALHEMTSPGTGRRLIGLVGATIAAALLVLSNAKTALALMFLAPALAFVALVVNRWFRISIAVFLLSIIVGYLVVSTALGVDIYKLSSMIYGDRTFTGRTHIWAYAQSEIAQRPLLGWGYQSFWLVGPDSPSLANATGWVKTMPNAHNGYLDTILELGYAGFALLLAFLLATTHAVGSMARLNFRRAWLVLTLILMVMMSNGLESRWMRGFEFMWILFLVLATECARYSVATRTMRPIPSAGKGHPASNHLPQPDRARPEAVA